jgi:hypothetical protein
MLLTIGGKENVEPNINTIFIVGRYEGLCIFSTRNRERL